MLVVIDEEIAGADVKISILSGSTIQLRIKDWNSMETIALEAKDLTPIAEGLLAAQKIVNAVPKGAS